MSLSITVITPSLNQGRFIENTIQSVVGQNIKALQYLVFDGGSTDNTISILNRYENLLNWVSEPDNGQANAVNKGLKIATGDIIGWLNSDDTYAENALSKVLDYFDKHPEVDVLYGDTNNVDMHGKVLGRYPTEKWNFSRLRKTCYISQPAVFLRRKLIDQYGYLNETLHYCLDYEYWLRLAVANVTIHHLPILLASSRIYPETKTQRAPLEANFETLRMLRDKFGYVPSQWIINHAIVNLKQKGKYHFPEMKFIFHVLSSALIQAVRWNGSMRGLRTWCAMPISMCQMLKQHVTQRQIRIS